jgi:cholesterol oxidase
VSYDYDYIVIGSGFGGSVSAYRLSQKGYKVLVIEKGKRFAADDFPKTNWNLRKWLWLPSLRFHGIFKMTFFRHVGILSGVGVGGGSLVYANTLPVPKTAFFNSGSWQGITNWESELKPHYQEAKRMLGANPNPYLGSADKALLEVAKKNGLEKAFIPADVAVYFGKAGKEVNDPYFNGEGPTRTGCTFCGACMTGCRFNAKNTLDKNYLYLAEKNGVKVLPETLVTNVIPLNENGSDGYTVETKSATKIFKTNNTVKARNIIFSGGVLGTVKLLLELKKTTLPNLSKRVGEMVRTNNESLIGIVSENKNKDMTEGVAIGSVLHTDENSHLEPVRYGKGSGFWKIMMLPLATGSNIFVRLAKSLKEFILHPVSYSKIIFSSKFAQRSTVLLFMQTLNSTLTLKNTFYGLNSIVKGGEKPAAFIPEAVKLANDYAKEVKGKPMVVTTETLFGIPTTAHILGGAVIGETINEGVINHKHEVFGYENIMVCDGSAVSSNPGVNPSLTITAMTERAMSFIKNK